METLWTIAAILVVGPLAFSTLFLIAVGAFGAYDWIFHR